MKKSRRKCDRTLSSTTEIERIDRSTNSCNREQNCRFDKIHLKRYSDKYLQRKHLLKKKNITESPCHNEYLSKLTKLLNRVPTYRRRGENACRNNTREKRAYAFSASQLDIFRLSENNQRKVSSTKSPSESQLNKHLYRPKYTKYRPWWLNQQPRNGQLHHGIQISPNLKYLRNELSKCHHRSKVRSVMMRGGYHKKTSSSLTENGRFEIKMPFADDAADLYRAAGSQKSLSTSEIIRYKAECLCSKCTDNLDEHKTKIHKKVFHARLPTFRGKKQVPHKLSVDHGVSPQESSNQEMQVEHKHAIHRRSVKEKLRLEIECGPIDLKESVRCMQLYANEEIAKRLQKCDALTGYKTEHKHKNLHEGVIVSPQNLQHQIVTKKSIIKGQWTISKPLQIFIFRLVLKYLDFQEICKLISAFPYKLPEINSALSSDWCLWSDGLAGVSNLSPRQFQNRPASFFDQSGSFSRISDKNNETSIDGDCIYLSDVCEHLVLDSWWNKLNGYQDNILTYFLASSRLKTIKVNQGFYQCCCSDCRMPLCESAADTERSSSTNLTKSSVFHVANEPIVQTEQQLSQRRHPGCSSSSSQRFCTNKTTRKYLRINKFLFYGCHTIVSQCRSQFTTNLKKTIQFKNSKLHSKAKQAKKLTLDKFFIACFGDLRSSIDHSVILADCDSLQNLRKNSKLKSYVFAFTEMYLNLKFSLQEYKIRLPFYYIAISKAIRFLKKYMKQEIHSQQLYQAKSSIMKGCEDITVPRSSSSSSSSALCSNQNNHDKGALHLIRSIESSNKLVDGNSPRNFKSHYKNDSCSARHDNTETPKYAKRPDYKEAESFDKIGLPSVSYINLESSPTFNRALDLVSFPSSSVYVFSPTHSEMSSECHVEKTPTSPFRCYECMTDSITCDDSTLDCQQFSAEISQELSFNGNNSVLNTIPALPLSKSWFENFVSTIQSEASSADCQYCIRNPKIAKRHAIARFLWILRLFFLSRDTIERIDFSGPPQHLQTMSETVQNLPELPINLRNRTDKFCFKNLKQICFGLAIDCRFIVPILDFCQYPLLREVEILGLRLCYDILVPQFGIEPTMIFAPQQIFNSTVEASSNQTPLWLPAVYNGPVDDLLQLQGQGIYVSREYRYEGAFKNGRNHGWGKMVSKCGERYEGYWKEGRRYGQGIVVQSSGKQLKGEWVCDVLHGHGTMQLHDGLCYEGDWQNGALDGWGVLLKQQELIAVGQFSEGKPNGWMRSRFYYISADNAIATPNNFLSGHIENYDMTLSNTGILDSTTGVEDVISKKGFLVVSQRHVTTDEHSEIGSGNCLLQISSAHSKETPDSNASEEIHDRSIDSRENELGLGIVSFNLLDITKKPAESRTNEHSKFDNDICFDKCQESSKDSCSNSTYRWSFFSSDPIDFHPRPISIFKFDDLKNKPDWHDIWRSDYEVIEKETEEILKILKCQQTIDEIFLLDPLMSHQKPGLKHIITRLGKQPHSTETPEVPMWIKEKIEELNI